MSRIYDALKKAEQEARSAQSAGPGPAPSEADSASLLGPDLVALPGNWGPIGADQLRDLTAVRRLIEARIEGRAHYALAVMSSVDGEGSSTVALAFARTLVSDPRLRLLLVEAEGNSREVSRLWADPTQPGWSDCESADHVERAIRRTPLENFDVLPFGTRSSASPALLSELLVEGVRRVAASYNYVLFDGGSVLETPLARYLAPAMDGVLLVVHASGTRREICQKAVEELRKTQAQILGVVLNRRQYLIPEAIYKRL